MLLRTAITCAGKDAICIICLSQYCCICATGIWRETVSTVNSCGNDDRDHWSDLHCSLWISLPVTNSTICLDSIKVRCIQFVHQIFLLFSACRVFFLRKHGDLTFEGNWLLTSPDEDQMVWGSYNVTVSYTGGQSGPSTPIWSRRQIQQVYTNIMLHVVRVHTVLYAQTAPKTATNTSSTGTLSAAKDKIISESGSTPDQEGGDLSRSHRYGSISYRRIGGSMTTDEVELVNSANPQNS